MTTNIRLNKLAAKDALSCLTLNLEWKTEDEIMINNVWATLKSVRFVEGTVYRIEYEFNGKIKKFYEDIVTLATAREKLRNLIPTLLILSHRK